MPGADEWMGSTLVARGFLVTYRRDGSTIVLRVPEIPGTRALGALHVILSVDEARRLGNWLTRTAEATERAAEEGGSDGGAN
jgi:hypothetical protein